MAWDPQKEEQVVWHAILKHFHMHDWAVTGERRDFQLIDCKYCEGTEKDLK
jgi:hypothetical protein